MRALGDGSLFLCNNAFTLGAYAIAVSRDKGATIHPITRFTDVKGPIECVGDARANLCASSWADTKASFTLAPDDAGSTSSSAKKRRRDGGTGINPPVTADAGDENVAVKRKSSCGCDVVGRSPSSPSDLSLFIVGLLPLMHRRLGRRMRGSKLTQHTPNCTI